MTKRSVVSLIILIVSLILGILVGMYAAADTPPARVINAETYDAAGNAITSHTSGGSRGLDSYILNNPLSVTFPSAQPVSGNLGRTWTLLNTTDSVNVGNFPASFGSTQVGSWNINLNAGSNTIGKVDQGLGGASAWKVDGSAVTQPVSGAVTANAGTGTFTVGQSSGTNLHVNVDSAPTTTVTGTVTANAGTNLNTSALNLEATQSAFKSANHTDLLGINTTLGTPAQEHITAGSPHSVRLSDGTSFYIGFKSGDSIGNTAFIANAGTNLNTSALNLETTQSAFKSANHTDLLAINTTLGSPMQNSGGSVTANAGTNLNTSALALSATQTNGTQKSQQVDGSGNVQPAGDVASRKVFVQPTDGTNSQGYTASSEAKVLVTPLTSSSTVTVVQPTGTNLHTVVDSGTITANAGTNLNTSLLALQSGSNTMLDRSGSGTITALNQAVTFTTNGMSSVDINVTGTWTATLGIEGQAGDGTWTALNCSTIGSDIILQAFLNNNQATCAIGGFNQARVRASAFTSGSASVQYNLGSGVNNVHVMNFSAGSLQVTANAGTNLNTSLLALDTSVTGLQVSQGSTTSGQKGGLVMGAVTTNQPSYTTAQTSPLSLTLRGGLRSKVIGLDTAQLIRNAYSSTNVTTAAYVQLVASTTVEINRLYIFDSSGQDLVLAVGGAGSEVDQIQISPGGWESAIELYIPSGSRISVKAVSATASSGILLITGLK